MGIFRIEYRIPQDLAGTSLEPIVRNKLHEIAGASLKWSSESIEMALERSPVPRSLKRALLKKSPAVIAEVKKASPSAGVIRPDFDPMAIFNSYQDAGAAAVSVVTEGRYFGGRLETISSLRWASKVPLLRKDFILDRYQILESRHAGADAVLLIAALHDAHSLKSLRGEAERLGMEALVEVHTPAELEKALASGATIIGVNNRDLRTLQVSLDISRKLGPQIPRDVVAVTESGIRTREDIDSLLQSGFRGFLIGETLMRAASPGAALGELIGSGKKSKAS
jgi:indole-3-glycerol phosphate synthase